MAEATDIRQESFMLEKDDSISCSYGICTESGLNTATVQALFPGDKTYEQTKVEHKLKKHGDRHTILRKLVNGEWIVEEEYTHDEL